MHRLDTHSICVPVWGCQALTCLSGLLRALLGWHLPGPQLQSISTSIAALTTLQFPWVCLQHTECWCVCVCPRPVCPPPCCCTCCGVQLDLDWAFQLKDGVPQISRQSLIPGGSVELTHENLFGDSQSLSLSLSSSDWRNPAADLGFQMSYTEPFYAPNTTRNVQVGESASVPTRLHSA